MQYVHAASIQIQIKIESPAIMGACLCVVFRRGQLLEATSRSSRAELLNAHKRRKRKLTIHLTIPIDSCQRHEPTAALAFPQSFYSKSAIAMASSMASNAKQKYPVDGN
jgi:hypothetical protein